MEGRISENIDLCGEKLKASSLFEQEVIVAEERGQVDMDDDFDSSDDDFVLYLC